MGMRFYKRIGGKAGLNLSKSGLSASFRTRGGSIGTRGYSLRTGISGLFFRGSWGKGSRRSGGGSDVFGCLAAFLRLGLTLAALCLLLYFLPAIAGLGLILVSYRSAEVLARKYPCYARRIRFAGLTLDAAIVVGVVVTYCHLNKNMTAQPLGPPTVAQGGSPENRGAHQYGAVVTPHGQSAGMYTITGALEATSSTLEIFSCEIKSGSAIIITEDTDLHLESATNRLSNESEATTRLLPGTVVIVEDTGLSGGRYFIRAYNVIQKSFFDTSCVELGRGWIDASKRQETATLFTDPFAGDFSPISANALNDEIRRVYNACDLKYPPRTNYSARKEFIEKELYKFKGKRVSLADPKIVSIESDKKDGFRLCYARCSKLQFSFPVSDKFAKAVKYNDHCFCEKMLRLEGTVKGFECCYGAGIYLTDVVLIAEIKMAETPGASKANP